MNILGSIMSKIFGASHPLAQAVGGAIKAVTAPKPMEPVDLEKLLTEMAGKNPEKLDWKKSIVDLLKLLGIDSSVNARKALALELGYSQKDIDSKGSAEMNMWLHKQVLKKIAENGGKVPADLLD